MISGRSASRRRRTGRCISATGSIRITRSTEKDESGGCEVPVPAKPMSPTGSPRALRSRRVKVHPSFPGGTQRERVECGAGQGLAPEALRRSSRAHSPYRADQVARFEGPGRNGHFAPGPGRGDATIGRSLSQGSAPEGARIRRPFRSAGGASGLAAIALDCRIGDDGGLQRSRPESSAGDSPHPARSGHSGGPRPLADLPGGCGSLDPLRRDPVDRRASAGGVSGSAPGGPELDRDDPGVVRGHAGGPGSARRTPERSSKRTGR